MKFRTETIGDCTLILGNCLQVMPTLGKVDAVVTDAPYGLGEGNSNKHKSRANLAPATDYGDSNWDDKTADPRTIEICKEISRYQIIFGGQYYDLPKATCILTWDKENGGSDQADCENAWTNLKKANRLIRWQWMGFIRKGQMDKTQDFKRVHPTQKPVEVMEWCIEQLPEGTEIILDQFMGSGTTGVACAKLGHKFIGIEKDEKYFDIACSRVEEAYRQPDMFIEPPKKYKNDDMFKGEE